MPRERSPFQTVSPWWRYGVAITLIVGFAVLISISHQAYRGAPPIPARAVAPAGEVLFSGTDIMEGQQVFLRYALMENGTVWGHGAYLGPDFSASYLHTLAVDTEAFLSRRLYGRNPDELSQAERDAVGAEVVRLLKENRYDAGSGTLRLTEPEVESYRRQIGTWGAYFSGPVRTGGLPAKYLDNPKELQDLTAFFAWAAWASVANRPGKPYSYTNNFPFDRAVGNTLTSDAILWSALSLIALLAGTAVILFLFGRFHYLGWRGHAEHIHPQLLPGQFTESQRGTIKYFFIVTLLFLGQVLVGDAVAHFRADPGTFYGIDLARLFPSNILRTWHLQLV
jgi:nitric oxide reductase subunit B